MKRTWTIIGVRNVPSSFKWYQSLFGQPESPPGHGYFGQILDADGTVLLCLHQWGAHEHPTLMSPENGPPGNGLLLFFRVDDYEMALKRARALVDRFEEEPHVNPNTQTMEFSLSDPDGYYVTISSLSADREIGSQPLSTRLAIMILSAVEEELIYWVFIATLVAWLVWLAVSHFNREPKQLAQWVGTLVAAYLFGLAHVANLSNVAHPVLR